MHREGMTTYPVDVMHAKDRNLANIMNKVYFFMLLFFEFLLSIKRKWSVNA